jgi:hypothetical protein
LKGAESAEARALAVALAGIREEASKTLVEVYGDD